MPRLKQSATLRRDLSVVAYEHLENAEDRGFIGPKVMPTFETPEKTADYPVIPIEATLNEAGEERAFRAGYHRDDFEFDSDTYTCKEYGHEEPIDDGEAALYENFFDIEVVATQRSVDKILRGQEMRIASKVQATANAVGSAAVGVAWNVPATAKPKADIKAGSEAMRLAGGLVPNAVIMSKTVFENVLICDELKSYLQYTSPHLVQGMKAQLEMLARYFNVDEVLVGNAMKNIANKGQAASLADIWSDGTVSLARVSDGSADLKQPCLGRSFLWTADSPEPVVVESYREEQIKSDIVRARHNVAEKIVYKGGLYQLTGISG